MSPLAAKRIDPDPPATESWVVVITPELKPPPESRRTIAFAVFVVVAVIVALLAWLVIVPAVVALVAVEALPLKAAVIVPAVKLPEPSRATMVDAVLALVALDATVNEDAPDWLAVNDAEPDRPVPETAIVNVPLFTVGRSEVSAIVPVVAGIVMVVAPATAEAFRVVVPDVEPA